MKYVKVKIELLSSNIEDGYEKYQGLYRDDSQLKFIGKLWKHYNTTLFEDKLPKFKHIIWLRQSSKQSLGMYEAIENSFLFLPTLFKLPFSKFKKVVIHEMCHQAQHCLGHPDDKDFIPSYKMTKFQRQEKMFNGGYEPIASGHLDKAWMYWTEKAGIDSGHTSSDLDISRDEVKTDKQKEKTKQKLLLVEDWKEGKTEKIETPESYLPAKFWNSKKWVDGMIIGPNSNRLMNKKWWFLHEEGLSDGKFYTVESYSLYEVSNNRSKEIISDPRWRKGVDKILKSMKK